MLVSMVLLLCLLPAPTLLLCRPFSDSSINRIYPIHMLIIAMFALLSPLFTHLGMTIHYHLATFADQRLALCLHYDALTWVMLSLVGIIALTIQSYAARYLLSDPNQNRFMAQLSLLVFSVMLLVLSGSLFTAFIAWQCIGLSLYLLLNHYHYDQKANKAAKKKFMINRVGDISFLLAVVLTIHQFGSTDFQILFTHAADTKPFSLFLIVIAIMTKSAQFPFHIWLIDTMEAPTPVSALMHGGVINAGGYLLARLSPWYDHFSYVLTFIAVIGLCTALIGNFFMHHQADTKRQLAYSTMGQMGYMLMQCGLGCFASAVFHLMAHGFYKANLFLSSGSTLSQGHAFSDPNDLQPNRVWMSTLISLLLTPLFITTGILYFNWQHVTNLNPLLWLFMAITLYQLIRLALQEAHKLAATPLLLIIIVAIYMVYLLSLTHFTQLLSDCVAEIALSGIGWRLLSSLLTLSLVIFLLKKHLPYRQHKRWLQTCYLIALNKGHIEAFYRQYLITPIRRIGDQLIAAFICLPKYAKPTLAVLACFLCVIPLITPPATSNPIMMTFYLGIMCITLIIANRVTNLFNLIALITFSLICINATAFAMASRMIQTIGLFQTINGFLICAVFLALLTKRHHSMGNIVVSENRLPWCHFYMSTLLMLLVGIPGTSSFISELYLLKALAPDHFILAILFGVNMLLLALVILHTLQVHFFNPDKIRQHATHIPKSLHLLFVALIGFNVLCGCHPSVLIQLLY